MKHQTVGQAHAQSAFVAAGLLGTLGLFAAFRVSSPRESAKSGEVRSSSKVEQALDLLMRKSALYSGKVLETPPAYNPAIGGKERWAVKVGADAGAATIPLVNPTVVRVEDLLALKRPAGLPLRKQIDDGRRHGIAEKTLYECTCYVIGAKHESDGDFHLVLAEQGVPSTTPLSDAHVGGTMIAEIPDPAAVATGSPWRAEIAQARKDFVTLCGQPGRFTRFAREVKIYGVGFYDFAHGQTGVAPNALEIHPVLKIEAFNPTPY